LLLAWPLLLLLPPWQQLAQQQQQARPRPLRALRAPRAWLQACCCCWLQ
jgi:hypothetical protein